MKTFSQFIKTINHTDLLVTAALAVVVGVVLHVLYPFPFTFPDSSPYVFSAASGTFDTYRPMGYASFLNFVHVFTASTTGLFVVSYVLNAAATLFLLFSARYLLNIKGRAIFLTLCGAALLAPRIIFATNFLMSDGLFNTLAMLFLATALWLCFTRNWWLVVLHLLCFVFLYKVRFSGMFFVPVSAATLWMASPKKWRIAAAVLPVVIFALLFSSTKKEYVRQTGVETFSGFSGWQLMNNALVLMPEAKKIPAEEFEGEVQEIHRFMQSVPDSLFRQRYSITTFYMWDRELPPKQLLFAYMQATGRNYGRSWVEVGKLFGEYAGALIRREPGRYITNFVWPSLLSTLRCHDMSEEGTLFKNEPFWRSYFGIEVDEFQYDRHFFRSLLPVRKVLNVVWWVGWLASAVWFFGIRWRRRDEGRMGVALLFVFLLIYWGTSALASPNTTWRYTMPMFVPALVAMAWCVSTIIGSLPRGGRERGQAPSVRR